MSRPRTPFEALITRVTRDREEVVFFALCALVGIAGAFLGELFKWSVDLLRILIAPGGNVLDSFVALPGWARVAVPAVGALCAGWLLVQLPGARTASGGVPEVMEIVLLGKKSLQFRPVINKCAAALCAIGTGCSLGREGPIIQLATATAARFGRLLPLSEESWRLLTAGGVAAGVAAAYRTPLAATLFVVEIIIGRLNVRVLGAAATSAFVAVITRDIVFGTDEALYAVGSLEPFRIRSLGEILGWGGLGLATGVVAVLFQLALQGGTWTFSKLNLPVPVKTLLGGLAVGWIGFHWPEIFGNGYEASRRMALGETPLGLDFHAGWSLAGTLGALVLLKIIATAGSVSVGLPGGIFTPTLFVGAATGLLAGEGFRALAPGATGPAADWALFGMAGALAATMHAPLLSTVMLVELCDDHHRLPALLAVSLVAYATARALRNTSIYTDELRRKGVATEGSAEARLLGSMRVGDLMRSDVSTIAMSMPFAEVSARFAAIRSTLLYVTDERQRLVGAIDLHDVKNAEASPENNLLVIASDLAKPIPVAYPDEKIIDVNRRLWLQDVGHIPVVKSADDPTWCGLLTRRDILGAVDREILRRNIFMAPVQQAGAARPDWFELPLGGRMETVKVPAALWGKSLSESELGRKYNVMVLAIQRTGRYGGIERRLATPDWILEEGDHIVILGPEPAVASLLSGLLPVDSGS